jgi:hypothetical protein
MLLPQKLADIFMEDIATAYLESSPFSGDTEDFFSSARSHMSTKFNISWSGGGTYGTCWDEDGPTEMSEDDEPEMTELDSFLEKYFSDFDISYEIKLKADSHTDYENDWYGGQSSTNRKSISFYQIAEVLCSTIYKDEVEYVDFETMLYDVAPEIINMGRGDYDKLIFRNHLNEEIEPKIVKTRKSKI